MKSRGITKLATVIAALAASLAVASPALAAPAVDGEFAITSVGPNNQLTAGPDGNMWVTMDAVNDVARITPAGVVQEFNGPDLATPTGIATAENKLWVTQANAVVSFDPADPVNTDAATAIAAVGDPRGIVLGPGGNLWTASGGNLIRIPPGAPGSFQVIPVAGLQQARSITVGGDGSLWIGDADATGGSILSVSPDAATVTPYTVDPGTGTVNIQGIAAGPGTQIGFNNPQGNPNTIGRLEPGGSPLLTPAPGTDAFGLALGADQAYWAAQFNTDNVGRLTSDGTYSTVGNFTAGSGPRQIAAGPNNTIWVTLDLASKIGRISGLEPPSDGGGGGGGGGGNGTAPDTELSKKPKKKVETKGKKAKVKFEFASSTAGATFECMLKKKGKKASFKPCTSPKKYKVKPGKYTFQVRATANGLTDAAPSKHKFKVVEG